MSVREISIALLTRALAHGVAGPSSDFDLNPAFAPTLGSNANLRPASVLIPVVNRLGMAQIILTRRAQDLTHHAGQVSFPGGKQDEGDATALDAALREADEEIGLRRDQVSILGAMQAHRTVTSFVVSPFVGLVDANFVARPDPSEVAEVFEVPLDFLLQAENFQIHSRLWRDQRRQFYVIPYGPHYVWGATARILRALAELVESVQ